MPKSKKPSKEFKQTTPSKEFKISIKVKASFVAFHFWENAPDLVEFLRNKHRHCFQVTLTIPCNHPDRDLEFFTVQELLKEFVAKSFEGTTTGNSCEYFAIAILEHFKEASHCTVSEDGENEAIVKRK
jgi:hypothetical protein